MYCALFFNRFRRQNEKTSGYGSPAAPVLQGSEAIEEVAAPILSNESETTKMATLPIIKNYKVEKEYEIPEAKEEPEIKSIPDIKENMIIENDDEVKKYVPQIKLVEEPETPPMTTSSTPVTTASEPSEKEGRTYKSITVVATKEDVEGNEEEYVNPLLDKKFPNFFTRFQKIFGDTRSSFFVKL